MKDLTPEFDVLSTVATRGDVVKTTGQFKS
jgi:hypothetical protein